MLASLFNKWTSRRKPIAGSCLWITSVSLCLFTDLWDSFAFKGYHWENLGIMTFFFFFFGWCSDWGIGIPLPHSLSFFLAFSIGPAWFWTGFSLFICLSHRMHPYVLMNVSIFFHMQFSLRHFCSASLHFMNWLFLGLPLNALSSSPTVSAYFAGSSNLDRQLLSGLEILSVHSFPTFSVANERIDITLMLLHLHITLCVFL